MRSFDTGRVLEIESKLGLNYIKSSKLTHYMLAQIENSNIEFRTLNENQIKRFENANKIIVGEGEETKLAFVNGKLIYKCCNKIKIFN
jgi:hypothetical protein